MRRNEMVIEKAKNAPARWKNKYVDKIRFHMIHYMEEENLNLALLHFWYFVLWKFQFYIQ